MSPIANLSNIIRMPRLGKIHLGIVVETPGKRPRPKATDYFVCPTEVEEVLGEKPKELPIMFPTEDPEQFAQQWYRAYSRSQGLVCIGDGVTSKRKVDIDTGAMASHETKEGRWVWTEGLSCDPAECPEYHAKTCRRVMNLQVLLPTVPGLGVWQIDTTSFYSIVNINSMVKMLQGMLGRCSFIPLVLVLGPIEVSPAGLKKKTVFIMHVKKDIVLADLAKLAQLPPARALIPEPEESDLPLLYAEDDEEDGAGAGIAKKEVPASAKKAGGGAAAVKKAVPSTNAPAGAAAEPPQMLAAAPPAPAPTPEEIEAAGAAAEKELFPEKAEKVGANPNRDPNSIKNLAQLYSACFEDFKLYPSGVNDELGVKGPEEITESPAVCYAKVAAPRR